MLFGTNRTWNVVGSKELTVGLSHRMVLTPYAAKRLATLLASPAAGLREPFRRTEALTASGRTGSAQGRGARR